MTKVICTVSGTRFEISCKCLEGEPFQRLPLMVTEAKKNGTPLVFDIDRPVERFAAIVAYYQTGELHIPAGVCPVAFQTELLYWDIDSSKLSDCCVVRYISFLEEQKTARQFRHEVRRPLADKLSADVYIPVTSHRMFGRFRKTLWGIVDNDDSSILGKIYFFIMFLLIMVSIFSLAFSTMKVFKRKLSKCEMIEYLDYTNHKDSMEIKRLLGNPSCDSIDSVWDDYDWDKLDGYFYIEYDGEGNLVITEVKETGSTTTASTNSGAAVVSAEWTSATLPPTNAPIIGRVKNDGGGKAEGSGMVTTTTTATATASSASSFTLSTLTSTAGNTNRPDIGDDKGDDKDNDKDELNDNDHMHPPPPPPQPKKVNIPDLRTTIKAFDIIDIVLMVCFSLDLLLRLVSCPSIPKYFLSVINILDAIALIGTYVYVTVTSIKKDQKYVDNWFDVIEYLQILRTLRLFRLVKNVRATKVLVYAVKESFKDLLILLMFLFIAVCTFASIVYFAESKKDFESIPVGWWWAVVTLTTVGYGDFYPKTWIGRAVGTACALTGVVLIALTLPIFVNNFLTLYQYAMVEDVLQSKLQKHGAHNTEGTVSKIDVKPVNTDQTDVVMTKPNGNTLTLTPK